MERRIDPSTRIEEAIEAVLLDGISGPDELSQLGRLGAELILQRAVEDEMAAFLGRARYERRLCARISWTSDADAARLAAWWSRRRWWARCSVGSPPCGRI
ncbi:MAG: hypothetical protein ABIZ30_03180 [Candidatus Limnocylindrales bacterium]